MIWWNESVFWDCRLIYNSWGEIAFLAEPMARNMKLTDECCMYEDSYDMDIEPDDINVTDTVTVVWEIE